MTPRRPPLLLPIATALILATVVLVGSCAAERGVEALKLLNDIANGTRPAASDGGVTVRGVAYDAAIGDDDADLYLPAAAPPADAALVLVPGLAPRGKDDPRLVALAGALARARIAVLVPEIASLRGLRAGPENVHDIAEALRFLSGAGRALWSDAVARPVGVAAASYAVGPAILATLEPDLAGRVQFLIGIGGYHDMTAAVTFFTTGWHRDTAGTWQHGAPNAYGKWAFVLANAERVADPRDRSSLVAMARRRLADLAAPIDDLVRGLGREGRSIHALVTNRDRDRVAGLIAALPASIRDDMAALDLAGRDLSAAPARALLIHGRDDAIIPASESMALAAALPGRAELILLDSLAHVDLGPRGGIGDFFRLWRASAWLLAARDDTF